MQSRRRRWAGAVGGWFFIVVVLVSVDASCQLALGRTLDQALATSIGTGVAVGTLIAVFSRRQRADLLRGAPASMTPAQRDEARQATRPGRPVPADPAIRQEAVRLIRALAQSAAFSSSRPTVIVFAVAGLVLVILGIALSPWWFVVAAGFLFAAVWITREAAAHTSRLALLEHGAATDRPSSE